MKVDEVKKKLREKIKYVLVFVRIEVVVHILKMHVQGKKPGLFCGKMAVNYRIGYKWYIFIYF